MCVNGRFSKIQSHLYFAKWRRFKRLIFHVARQFAIKVDPTGLPPGAHYAEVCGYDVSKCFQGALFRVPVTVLIPTQLVYMGWCLECPRMIRACLSRMRWIFRKHQFTGSSFPYQEMWLGLVRSSNNTNVCITEWNIVVEWQYVTLSIKTWLFAKVRIVHSSSLFNFESHIICCAYQTGLKNCSRVELISLYCRS